MPPEQLRGQHADARADQFSYCVALWEAVYGQRPFRDPADRSAGLFPALISAIAAGPVLPTRGDRPRWLASLLTRGLAVDPDQRWATLQALLDEIAAHRASTARRPWRFSGPRMIGLTAVAIAAAAATAWQLTRPKPAPQFHLIPPLISGIDLQAARLSPDGRQLAIVVGHKLAVRDLAPGGQERVLLDHGVDAVPWSPAWSPDGKRILVGVEPDILGPEQPVLVNVDSGTHFPLPRTGIATFLSNDEIALTAYRDRSIEFISPDAPVITAKTCVVDGDYALIRSLSGMPDGTMIVETVKGDAHTLVILSQTTGSTAAPVPGQIEAVPQIGPPDGGTGARSCNVRATVRAESISSFALSDSGTLIALTADDGFRELLELSLDNEILSRRRVSGDFDQVLGRRHGVDYVATRVQKTHLDRIGPDGWPRRLHTVDGDASFSLAPDGETLAWVEFSGHAGDRGHLRRASLRSGLRDVPLLRDDALMAEWSPGGDRLAVLVDGEQGPAIVVIDRDGKELRQLPLHPLARKAAPVWLDDHRIAAASEDYLSYQWFDLNSDLRGELMDSKHGGTYWLAASPSNRMLAVWRNGPPGIKDPATPHLWLQPRGGQLAALRVEDAVRHHLSPSWSPEGELFVRALQTGMVSRVALDTGALTPVVQLLEVPCSGPCDSRLMFPEDGDILAVDIELSLSLSETVPDEPLKLPPVEPGPDWRR